jgi:ribosomal protein S18 acetylase RimI-like enzyme
MAEVLRDMSRESLVEAFEASMREIFCSVGFLPGCEVYDGADLLWTITSIPYGLFNSVLCARLEPEVVSAAIDAAVARAKSRQVPMRWRVGPLDTPPDLGQRLKVRGFAHVEDLPIMAVNVLQVLDTPPPPPDLVLEEVRDAAALTYWCEITARTFELPSEALTAWQAYWEHACREFGPNLVNLVGCRGGDAVAASTVVFAGGAAAVYNVATIAAARRQGIGTAMTRAACAKARDLGYRIAILEASEMGLGIYRRIGFREYGRAAVYSWAL